MKTLKQYSQAIKSNLQIPAKLAELLEEAAADYAFYAEEMENVQLKKPLVWTKIKKEKDGFEREKYLSDALTEQCWRMTEWGQKELALKYKLKGLEKIISSIKTALYVKDQEAHNNY